ncbi:stage V sporulation protein AA [Alkalihalophilus pseudofirmus]|uniref:Stage V sporulation protein AA n=1 Tax=Alkalihalophilus pseudofirmus TaxID=79885 RepID=A0AAJ2NKF7_ALKPS|nr:MULTISPECIES: stage V sporulation protein AA [Alkalihalophilus]MDV2884211.1 stage V sporulation protein AA [Alkalihalophilus pseudofirmus]MED1601390.1 stage V sporulation protein AA [Alkalihalophilus marmarensis]OLS36053.1 stage V sporulation protein AA [Alkalihalophilus pseudofirmus]WEG18222.1 stage V sporulation protein AA [Alkalihalophilus pseudofirmus]
MGDAEVYIRMKQRIEADMNQSLTVGDVAHIVTNEPSLNQLLHIPIYQITKQDRNRVVIDVMQVIYAINTHVKSLSIQVVGAAQTIIEVNVQTKPYKMIYVTLIWFLLFVGAALAIMNFHEDVSMREVHGQIYYLVTGKTIAKPLLLQIPYSIGLGLGMILFFNHIFKKRLNDEPSPLEVEMFNYQQNLDQYVIMDELQVPHNGADQTVLKESGRKGNGY